MSGKSLPDYETVVAAAREVVADAGPGYVYHAPESLLSEESPSPEVCFYVHPQEDGTEAPGCIIARLLTRLEVMDLATLKQQENTSVYTIIERNWPETDRKTEYFLGQLQEFQDSRWTWGTALDRALDDARRAYDE